MRTHRGWSLGRQVLEGESFPILLMYYVTEYNGYITKGVKRKAVSDRVLFQEVHRGFLFCYRVETEKTKSSSKKMTCNIQDQKTGKKDVVIQTSSK